MRLCDGRFVGMVVEYSLYCTRLLLDYQVLLLLASSIGISIECDEA